MGVMSDSEQISAPAEMCRYLLALSLLLVAFGATIKPMLTRSQARFSALSSGDKYTPKSWKLVPRTQPHPKTQTTVKPDDYFSFIPTPMGHVRVGQPLTWASPCFAKNSASLTITANSTARLTLTSSDKTGGLLCGDTYLIGYVAGFDINVVELAYFTHELDFPGGWSPAELFDLQTNGIRIFLFPDSLSATAGEILDTVLLFVGGLIGAHVPEWTAADNLKFLEDHMGVKMPVRPIQRVNISTSEIKSGDFLGIIRLDGLDPMLAWAMGSHTGHTAVTLWIDGKLYVCESTISSAYWPNDGIQKTPWDEWLDLAEKASYNVIHLPLDPKIAAKFDVDAAIRFFKSTEGLPYGFHNQFTGWIDTPEDNFPGALTFDLATLLMPFGDWLLRKELGKGQSFDFLAQGLNKRLNTTGLTIVEAYMESAKRNIPLVDLVLKPELDEWIFTNDEGTPSGPAMVCDVFVTRIWKAGGIFGDLTNQFQAAEFTNWDAYTLNIFDANYVRPQQCVTADPDSQFCQLLGQYRMALPEYNTVQPFPHMREKCPTKPPDYKKPKMC